MKTIIIGIAGGTGSGKTTLMHLLNRLYDLEPGCGRITIGGVDISRIGRGYLRKNVAIVLQEPFLFSRTIRENIGITAQERDRDAMLEYVRAAARSACVDEAIEGFAQGYETVVGERGVTLSGGQKQRVAIARALATRPKYLLCDEATSALDPNTTQSILHLLKEINQTLGVTIVVITHEMRVIEQICQRVAVIDQSCIAEIGNVSDVFTHPKSDIAKALILPKSPAVNLPPCTGRRLRLVFDGSCSNEPVISRITLECHVPVNILFADTRIVEGSIYGHMVIDLPDDPQQFHDVLRWLDHNHISYLQEDGSHV